MLSKRIIACLDVRDGRVVMGVNFEGLREAGDPAALAARYNREGIDEVVILDVVAEGPAAEAGLEPGDVLLGPPGEPFQERQAVREWTMQATIGASSPLLVLRGLEEREVAIRMAPHPIQDPRSGAAAAGASGFGWG